IHYLYLLAYFLHVLQLLDLTLFSITKLAYCDDASPIKKERFILFYNATRIQGLSNKVIRDS
ncbi:hypothetical protein EK21DRAFT_72577, partial [Setomelanomma holmii]